MCFLPRSKSFFCCMSLRNGQLFVCVIEILTVAILSTQLYLWSKIDDNNLQIKLFLYVILVCNLIACMLALLVYFNNAEMCIKVAVIFAFVLRIITLINIVLAIFQLVSHEDKSRLIDLLLAVLYTISASYSLIGINSYYHMIYGEYEN